MSHRLSSLLFTFASQTIERQRKQRNLSKRKRLRSIGFSLQLCFHTAVEAGCGALMNDTLMFLSPLSLLCQSSAPESCHCDDAGALGWVCVPGPDSPQCHVPQSTAVPFVIVDFRRCHSFAASGEGTRRHDLSESCILLNYPSLCSPCLRGGVKQLTYGPEKYVTAVFIVQEGIELPFWQ